MCTQKFTAVLAGILFLLLFSSCRKNHYLVYQTGPDLIPNEEITLRGRFDAMPVKHKVLALSNFGNPAIKVHDGKTYRMRNRRQHFTWYIIDSPAATQQEIIIDNQFGEQTFTLGEAKFLITPSAKRTGSERFPIPRRLDHYKLYEITENNSDLMGVVVELSDQFADDVKVDVIKPEFFAVPVEKVHDSIVTPIRHKDRELVFYSFDLLGFEPGVPSPVFGRDQFRRGVLDIQNRKYLGVPTETLKVLPPEDEPPELADSLNHFLVYDVDDVPGLQHPFELQDRWHSDLTGFEANTLTHFVTPAEKIHDRDTFDILDPNHHATWYELQPASSDPRSLQISNQFGDQDLVLGDPKYLFTPAGKVHGGKPFPMPSDLDHYLIYEVTHLTSHFSIDQVDVGDQFKPFRRMDINAPLFYGVPVVKNHAGNVFEIVDTQNDIAFYPIRVHWPVDSIAEIDASDQFREGTLTNLKPILLGVPTSDVVE